MKQTAATAIVCSLLAGSAAAQQDDLGEIWITTDDGSVTIYEAESPWLSVGTIAAPGNDAIIRDAGQWLVLFDRQTGALEIVSKSGAAILASRVVPGAPYKDLCVLPDKSFALTKPGDSRVWRYKPEANTVQVLTDLLPFNPDGLDARSMAVSGKRLYVQAQPAEPPAQNASQTPDEPPRGLLAVVAWENGGLVDAEPQTIGVQGIELTGAYPDGEMILSQRGTRLTVSAPTDQFDFTGAIDVIDLGTLRIVATPVNERGPNSYGHLGGFAHDQRGNGIFVFHTDLASSSHLQWFTVFGGAAPHPGHQDLLGAGSNLFEISDKGSLAYFGQGGFVPGEHGVHVYNVATRTRLTTQPLSLPGNPVDIEYVQ